ncbi:amino acid ABC transporter permease [Agrilactobacillus yilanensis]|uniref:Amino acid ABC transporter permease n=1 Tax=Agrilactobacillus yilanensis TaxID=2485997 RepID=A0ABW4J9P4_9LACO|nr:amino acid ABC transporter permease [Agrilactobacillus yilanensis]
MLHTIVTSVPELLKAGIQYTIPLALISFFFGLILAVLTAVVKLMPKPGHKLPKLGWRILQAIFAFYVWLFRSTPLLVQLFIIFFGLPNAGIELPAFLAAVVTFSLNTGAYASETIRASISSIPNDQWEAAYTLGMKRPQILMRIIFPQAMRIAIPPLSNSFIGLVKDTSLASSITILEMFTVSQQITAKNYEPLLMYTIVAAIYAIFCSVLTYLQHYLEKRTSKYLSKDGAHH